MKKLSVALLLVAVSASAVVRAGDFDWAQTADANGIARSMAKVKVAAAKAAVLVPAASATSEEAITLVCQQEEGPGNTDTGGTFTLRVDFSRKIVSYLRPDGTVFMSAEATITESNIRWFGENSSKKEQGFNGELNRLSGRAWVGYTAEANFHMSGPCSRVAKKF